MASRWPVPSGLEGIRGQTACGLETARCNFAANIAAWRDCFRRRRARFATARPAFWGSWAYLSLVTVILFALILDGPVGAYRRQWSPELIGLARQLTHYGKSDWILIPIGIFLLLCAFGNWSGLRRRDRAFLGRWTMATAFVFVCVAVPGLISAILKGVIGRGRPGHFAEHGSLAFNPLPFDASWASFPSGHATVMGALGAALALLCPPLRLHILAVAIFIAATRVLVGAHYPSDVAAGLAFGAWSAYFAAYGCANLGIIFAHGDGMLPRPRRGFVLIPRSFRIFAAGSLSAIATAFTSRAPNGERQAVIAENDNQPEVGPEIGSELGIVPLRAAGTA